MAAPRKYSYEGTKKPVSIRLSPEERELILSKFESLQEFIQHSIEIIEDNKNDNLIITKDHKFNMLDK